MVRVIKGVLGAAVLSAGLLTGGAAAAGASPAGGAIELWVTPAQNSTGAGKVIVTGAIGDYGPAQKVNSAGKPSAKGASRKLVLKKGTIIINVSQFTAAQNNLNPTIDNTNCSATGTIAAPVQIVSGTGAYVGITGTVNLTADVAFILPKTKSGSCDTSGNGTPLAIYQTVSGPGTVSFS